MKLGGNQLTGTLPSSLGSLTRLSKSLRAHRNNLHGTLPPSFGSLTGLEYSLQVSNNDLTGTVPDSYASLTSLSHYLHLSNTQLTGTVPAWISSLTHLVEGLDLATTLLKGTIPSSFGSMLQLEAIEMDNNPHITGTVPPSIGSLADLTTLELADCSLTGSLPASLASLTALRKSVHLGGNGFFGPFPEGLCDVVAGVDSCWLAGVGLNNCNDLSADCAAALTTCGVFACEYSTTPPRKATLYDVTPNTVGQQNTPAQKPGGSRVDTSVSSEGSSNSGKEDGIVSSGIDTSDYVDESNRVITDDMVVVIAVAASVLAAVVIVAVIVCVCVTVRCLLYVL